MEKVMNLVRKLVYVTLVMPFVYCSSTAIDSHESGVRRQRGTENVLDESQYTNTNKGSYKQRFAEHVDQKKQALIIAKQEPAKSSVGSATRSFGYY